MAEQHVSLTEEERQRRIEALDREALGLHGLTLEDDDEERCWSGCGLSKWDVLADMVMGCEGSDDDSEWVVGRG